MRTARLSTRLALLAAAGICIAVCGFALGVYLLIERGARERLDDSLVKTAQEFEQATTRNELGVRDFSAPPSPVPRPKSPAPKDPEPQAPAGTKVQVNEGGRPAKGGGAGQAADLPATSKPTPPRTIAVNGQRLRVLVHELPPTTDGRQRTVAVARPVADVEATLNVAKWSLGLGALLASLAAVGFALYITRRTLRPLVQVQSAAETVAASQDLSVRIPQGRPDEVGRLARSVNQMLERLEDAQSQLTATLDQQQRFAADASHELRTPLTALKGDIDLLARHNVPDDERAVVLAEMSASVERMGRMVEGLLALARAEGASAAAATPIDLTELVGEIARSDESELTEPLVVRAEPEALRALLSNLIDNGRRFGEVTVAGRTEGGWAVVVVSDDGPGIDGADRERIFDRFYRAPALRGTPGSGLGLAIARSAAERSGGSVTLLPDDGRGARFEVRLPLARSRMERPGADRWARTGVLRTR